MQQLDLFGNEISQTKKLEKEFLQDVIYDLLKNISLNDLVHLMTNELTASLEYYRLLNGENTCQLTSLLFNPHRLDISCRNHKYKSIFQEMKGDVFLRGIARAIVYLYNSKNSFPINNVLYRVFEMGVNGVGLANEFPPRHARDFCLNIGITKNCKVLDPCGGWGGRMIGISTICDYYECYEPSTKTYHGLLKLSEWIKKMNKDFNAYVHCLPFEDSNLKDNFYDFAITSPPYYNTEDYCDEETNSLNRYKTFDDWCNGFYIPLIQKTMNSLKKGACFVINIGDRLYPLSKVLLDNFSSQYTIQKYKDLLSGNTGGLRKGEKKGEQFYIIKK